MNKKLRNLLCINLFFCASFLGHAQDNGYFAPKLWLSNPKSAADTLADFDKLNFHRDLGVRKSNLWQSSKEINDAHHLFLVYKSKKVENMVSVMGQRSAMFLEGKNLLLNDTVNLDGYNEAYGELLDVQFADMKEGKFWMNPSLADSRIFELVLVDAKKKTRPVNEIRTYLSLKYGIDLIDYKQYSYNDKQLWDGSQTDFNRHIFGLARFSYFNLQPSKSVHSKDRDLIVSVPDHGAEQFTEGTYVLFGNNGKAFTFDRKTRKSQRQWLVQTNSDNLKVDLSIPVSRLPQNKDTFSEYELVVGANGAAAAIYKASSSDSLVIFRNVVFTKQSSSLVNLKEYRSDLKLDIDNSCKDIELKLDGPSNMQDFYLGITDDKGKNVLSSTTVKKSYTVTDNGSAYYDVSLHYNGKNLSKRIESLSSNFGVAKLQKHYTLKDGPVNIVLENNNEFTYAWLKDGKVIGTKSSFSTSEQGRYEVTVSNTQGCSVTNTFSVGAFANNEQWQVFPNPATTDDEVQVAFELAQKSVVNLSVYQNDGKLIKTMELGTVDHKTVSLGNFTSAAGVYMVVAYIDQIPQIKKIIIK